MGIIVAYGFCSSIGLFYGPMHNVLPFLLLGIGIDDMFVIVQSWDTLTETEKGGTLQEKFGKTLSHSGVAITITSLTDVLAFAIGGTTVLPALQSFCLYASVGIVAIYLFQVLISLTVYNRVCQGFRLTKPVVSICEFGKKSEFEFFKY